MVLVAGVLGKRSRQQKKQMVRNELGEVNLHLHKTIIIYTYTTSST